MNPIPATITHISSEGVQVTGHRLPVPSDNVFEYLRVDTKKDLDYARKLKNTAIQKYESSKFIKWVENPHPELPIEKGCVWMTGWYEKPLQQEYLKKVHIGQSCQIIETKNNKVKIVKLN